MYRDKFPAGNSVCAVGFRLFSRGMPECLLQRWWEHLTGKIVPLVRSLPVNYNWRGITSIINRERRTANSALAQQAGICYANNLFGNFWNNLPTPRNFNGTQGGLFFLFLSGFRDGFPRNLFPATQKGNNCHKSEGVQILGKVKMKVAHNNPRP